MALQTGAAQFASNALAHTKAATYTTLIASTSLTATLAYVQIASAAGSMRGHLIDLAVGAALSEVDFVTNLLVTGNNANTAHFPALWIPVSIASGARISARSQATTGASDCIVSIWITDGFAWQTGAVTVYGADTSDSGGTQIDAGATPDTKGAYTQITASTTADISWLTVLVGNLANATMTSGYYLIDIATGPATETVVIPDLRCDVDDTSDVVNPGAFGPFPVIIPSGTRLSARCQSNVTDATDRLLDVVLVATPGVPAVAGGLIRHPGLAGGLI